MTFAEACIEGRIRHKMSQDDLARSVDASRTSISLWEGGINLPKLDFAIKVAKRLGFSLDEISPILLPNTSKEYRRNKKIEYLENHLARLRAGEEIDMEGD